MSDNFVKTILVLSANPRNSTYLRLDQEVREIDEGLRRSQNRNFFKLEQRWAVRSKDLHRAILDLTPQVVHFSGHGVGDSGLALEDDAGQAKLLSTEAIQSLFELFAKNVECVVLNACYSEVQADAIAKYIPYVIGMNHAVGDVAAREFAVGFYDALGAGRDFEFAFKSGCVAIQLAGIPEYLTPVLKKKGTQEAKSNSASYLEEPSGQVPLDSRFYVERSPFMEQCCAAILTRGALIRIKAPRQMGKSSLMIRVLDYARQEGYRSTWLSLQRAGHDAFENLDVFLRWLCSSISLNLRVPNRVDEFWLAQATLGSNDKCTYYFEEHLLEDLNLPLALCLDEVDELFQHEAIALDFFGLVRSWHEESKINPLWQNLRLIITHSKEVNIPLKSKQSPFNVGFPIELPPFNRGQFDDLTQRHCLHFPQSEMDALMGLTGGQPYLLRLALYYLARSEITLARLLEVAPTQECFYGDHLRHHLSTLQKNPKLLEAMLQVVNSVVPNRVDAAHKLVSMGLAKFVGNDVVPLCDLYQRYFMDMLS
jgi:AAA-like domain/CHAT domain